MGKSIISMAIFQPAILTEPEGTPHKLPVFVDSTRSRCQVLVAGDSLELFDIDLGEQKWAVKPDCHVQVTVGFTWDHRTF